MAQEAVSVIVCTRDRTDHLEECLRALLAQRYDMYEIVVVDNAPSDQKTAMLCAELPVRYVCEPKPGLARARNLGLREAKYDFVAFTDDDTLPDPAWLTCLIQAFSETSIMAVTGRVEAADVTTPAADFFERAAGGMSKGRQRRDFHRRGMRSGELIAVQAVGVGANMAFRRAVFASVGQFDERLGAGTPARGADDLDMFHRVLMAGGILRYEPSALVLHRHRADLAGLRKQFFDTGCGFGVYLGTLLGRGSPPRGNVIRFMAGSWLPWLFGRLAKGAIGHHPLPFALLWAQVAGALHAPSAYRAIRRAKE